MQRFEPGERFIPDRKVRIRNRRAGARVGDPMALYNSQRERSALVLRLRTDLTAARKAVAEAEGLDAETKAELQRRADGLARDIDGMPTELPADFKAILPCNDIQAGIYALYAPLHRARGLSGLVAWMANRSTWSRWKSNSWWGRSTINVT